MKLPINRWPLAVIACVLLAFAAPYALRGHVPFPSTYLVTFFTPWSATHGMPVKNNAMPDVITQIYPWKRITADALRRGQPAFWNPYAFSGTAHLGNYQSATLSPVNLLFLVFPEIHAWSVMILLQPVLAGAFMYLFLGSLGLPPPARGIGALSYMFSGFVTVWMAYGTLGYAVLFLPLILFALTRYAGGGKYWGPLASAGIALSFLSGHFQISVYVALVSAGYAITLPALHAPAAVRIRAVLYLLLGTLLASPQILPALNSYSEAVRSSLFQPGEVIPWQYIVTAFSPDFYGNPVTRNDWFGHYAEWSSYAGVIPLLLAIAAMFGNRKNGTVKFFAAVGMLALLLSYRTPLVDLLFAARIPVLSTSAASRIIFVFSFSVAVLSAFGLRALTGVWQSRNVRRAAIHGIPAVLITAGIFIAVYVLNLPGEARGIALRNTVLPACLAGAFLAVLLIGSVLPARLRILPVVLLVLLTAGEMYRFAAKWMPFDPAPYVFPEVPVITKLRSLTGSAHDRVFGNIGGELGNAFGVPLIEGYDAVYQGRYGEFIGSVSDGKPGVPQRSVVQFDKRGTYADRVLGLLGVRFYAHKKSDGRLPWAYPFWEYPSYKKIWEDQHFEIHENSAALPRAFLASSYVLRTDRRSILSALYSPDLDPAETLVLETRPEPEPQVGSGSAEFTGYGLNAVDIRTDSSAPALLFISDTYAPGWTATLDGKPVPILRADYAFRVVSVPAGKHTVSMRYVPPGFMTGMALAGAALGVLGYSMIRTNGRKTTGRKSGSHS